MQRIKRSFNRYVRQRGNIGPNADARKKCLENYEKILNATKEETAEFVCGDSDAEPMYLNSRHSPSYNTSTGANRPSSKNFEYVSNTYHVSKKNKKDSEEDDNRNSIVHDTKPGRNENEIFNYGGRRRKSRRRRRTRRR